MENSKNIPQNMAGARGKTLTEKLGEYLHAQPGKWIDGRELANVAGCYGWRSRVADARKQFSMVIENRQYAVIAEDGSKFVRSEYRYVPGVQLQTTSQLNASTSAEPPAGLLFPIHGMPL